MFPVVFQSEAHFGFACLFFTCPMGHNEILRPENRAQWIKFLQVCKWIFSNVQNVEKYLEMSVSFDVYGEHMKEFPYLAITTNATER